MKPQPSIHQPSIVLIGIRGTGRSTLALLASNFLGFDLVDADSIFRKNAGVTEQAYIAKHGQRACRDQQLQVMQSVMDDNPTRTVIVFGLSAVLEPSQELLLEFGLKHPIIYVMRDPGGIATYLQHGDSKAIEAVVESANPVFRKLSNFEFYNLQDAAFAGAGSSNIAGFPPSSLLLKKVERDFLQLISSISPSKSISTRQAQSFASLAPLELKPYTYALKVPISQVFSVAEQFHRIDTITDAVELVIDLTTLVSDDGTLDHATATDISKAFYTLRRAACLPVIFHIEGLETEYKSSFPSPPASLKMLYLQAVRHGLRLNPDYVTIDMHLDQAELQSLIENTYHTKFIGHFYDADPALDAWDSHIRKALLTQAEELGCKLLRICQRAVSRADNVSVQKFIRYTRESSITKIPTAAYNTGVLGRMSVLHNCVLTPVTHPKVHLQIQYQKDAFQWMPDVPEALEALYASSRLHTLVFGIFGSNLHSSISPFMHNAAFAYCGMPHIYKTFQQSSLKEIAPILQDVTFGGASITHPLKSEIIRLVDMLSPAASAIGAVNTVIPLRSEKPNSLLHREERGRVMGLYGDNTDWIGIHTCIHRNLSPINAIKSRTVGLVLGAGGMARAAIYSMIYLGVKNIYIYNRTRRNAEEVATQFSKKVFTAGSHTSQVSMGDMEQSFGPSEVIVIESMDNGWPASTALPNIIVSCIPSPSFTLPDSWLSSRTGGVMIEVRTCLKRLGTPCPIRHSPYIANLDDLKLAYTPLETPLLVQVMNRSDRGWIAVNGLEVLPEQGISQFELFTGRTAPQNIMRAEVQLRYFGAIRHGSKGR